MNVILGVSLLVIAFLIAAFMVKSSTAALKRRLEEIEHCFKAAQWLASYNFVQSSLRGLGLPTLDVRISEAHARAQKVMLNQLIGMHQVPKEVYASALVYNRVMINKWPAAFSVPQGDESINEQRIRQLETALSLQICPLRHEELVALAQKCCVTVAVADDVIAEFTALTYKLTQNVLSTDNESVLPGMY